MYTTDKGPLCAVYTLVSIVIKTVLMVALRIKCALCVEIVVDYT